MYEFKFKDTTMECQFDLDQKNVEMVISLCFSFIQQHGFCDPSSTTMVLRELLIGGLKIQSSTGKKVFLQVSYIDHDRFKLVINRSILNIDLSFFNLRENGGRKLQSRDEALISELADNIDFCSDPLYFTFIMTETHFSERENRRPAANSERY